MIYDVIAYSDGSFLYSTTIEGNTISEAYAIIAQLNRYSNSNMYYQITESEMNPIYNKYGEILERR